MAVRSEADEPFHRMDVDVARIIRPKAKLRLREHDVAGKAERLGGAHGHKGEEAAVTALKMIRISRNNP